jgi:hypothetical protein
VIIIPNTLPLAGRGPVSPDELRDPVRRGWRCVRFEFCVSFVVATVRRQSPVYLTERWQERYLYGLGYNAVALLLGPWGVPWGVVWTARALWTNLTGGGDVTDAVLAQLDRTTETLP